MSAEENLKQALENKFDYLKGAVIIKRERRMALEVPAVNFAEVLKFVTGELNFSFLSAITGLDNRDGFEVIYHLNKDGGMVLDLKIRIPRSEAVIETVTPLFASADAYERELMDLLGIEVKGLAEGRRYPLPDEWPLGDYPLRKDWKGNLPANNEVKNA
ncbi:MAG: NADH-quinone oxidoreductase subunit C [Candidatus Omnitrophota bacterium]|nr:NADH-quinone oxidoreductase subunit C [Candidatus Omnitrophota bacterium]